MTFTDIYLTDLERFQQNICNGCGMPTGDADSFGHLVLSHFGTCMCSNVETNLSWTCLVSGLLNFEPLLIWTLLPNLTFYLLYKVSMEHMQRVRHANRGRYLPPDTWSYPIWDLHLFIQKKPYYLLVTLTEYDIHRYLPYRLGEVSTEYMQRVWHANRGRWLLRTPGPVPLWDLHVF